MAQCPGFFFSLFILGCLRLLSKLFRGRALWEETVIWQLERDGLVRQSQKDRSKAFKLPLYSVSKIYCEIFQIITRGEPMVPAFHPHHPGGTVIRTLPLLLVISSLLPLISFVKLLKADPQTSHHLSILHYTSLKTMDIFLT